MSVQKVSVGGLFTLEFIGDGRLLPITVKRSLIADLVDSAERSLNSADGQTAVADKEIDGKA